jgi:hypothetical protein
MSWAGPPTNVSRTSPPTVARASISVFARCSDSRIRKSSIYYSFCSYVLKPVCNWTWSYDYYAQPPPQHPMYGLQQGPPGQSRQQMQPASHPGQHMQRPPNQQMQYHFWKVCLVLNRFGAFYFDLTFVEIFEALQIAHSSSTCSKCSTRRCIPQGQASPASLARPYVALNSHRPRATGKRLNIMHACA